MRAQSTNGVTRHGRGERLARPCAVCRVSPSLASSRAARRVVRASDHSRAPASANRSLDRPVQHANGAVAPDRLVRSCHRGARLICNVIRTEKKDIGSVGIGVVCNDAVFIVAPRIFDDRREFQQPDTFGRSDLVRGNKDKNTSAFGCCERPRLFGQVAAFIGAAGNGRAAARSWRTDRGIGHHSRAGGPLHRLLQHSFDARGGSDITLVSTVGSGLIAIRAGRLSPLRRSAGCSTRRTTFGRFVGCGLIRGPYNTRLHLTAPRASFQFSPW